mgnify:CR=1 FL=1
MSEADANADGIVPGKRLIRQGGDKGLSLAERVADRLQRLAWRTPFHAVRLSGRHPLKLLAVTNDPFEGDAARGRAMLDGEIRFRGEAVPVDDIGFAQPAFSAGFAEYLHSFAWLRDLATAAPRATTVPVAEKIMRQWLDAHDVAVSDPAWRADLWGRRLLFWIAYAPLILSSSDLVYRSRVLHALARGSRHLDRAAGRVPPGVRQIAAWAGLVAAGLIVPGGDPRRSFGEAGLQRALGQSLFDDGGSVGRSPGDQLDAVMLLTLLRETYAARRIVPPEWLGAALTRMVSALLGIVHGDAGLASWQGAAPVDGPELAEVIAASGVRARPLRQARDWGYQRLAAAGTIVILDAAPPPVARVAAHGCASTLAFEMSDAGRRIVVNCGGGQALSPRLAQAVGHALRTTAAHSTLVVADSNSTAIHADGTLGKGVGAVELSRRESDSASRIEASHDGYARRGGFLHRRILSLSPDGRDLAGEDLLLPAGRRGKRGDTPFSARFHLAPGIEIAPTPDGQAAFLRLEDGPVWQFRCKGAVLGVEESLWIDGDGRPHETFQLVLSGTAPPGGTGISWRFHRGR